MFCKVLNALLLDQTLYPSGSEADLSQDVIDGLPEGTVELLSSSMVEPVPPSIVTTEADSVEVTPDADANTDAEADVNETSTKKKKR